MANWLSPKQALALIPCLNAEYQLHPLLGGHSNTVWRIDSAAGSYLLRLHSRQQQRAINRDAEHWAWQQAAAAGIAPQIHHWDPHHRFSLSQYLNASPLAPEGVSADKLAALVELISKLHQLDSHKLKCHDYAALALSAHSMQPCQEPWLRQLCRQASHWQQLLWQLGPEPCLCHHDPRPANILDDGQQLWLIDFEYAALGSPLFDLAALSGDWPEAQQQALRLAYCQQTQRAEFPPLVVAAAQALYLLLSLLWWFGTDTDNTANATDTASQESSQNILRLQQQLTELLSCRPQLWR